MQDQQDPVDGALSSLKGRQWPGDHTNNQTKDMLMKQFQKNQSTTAVGRHPVLVAALAILVLGSVGFAAAGGVQMVRNWIVTVEVNGEPVDVDPANVRIEENGEEVTVTLDAVELPGDYEEGATATVTVIATEETPAEVTITRGSTDENGELIEGDVTKVNVNVQAPDDQEE